MARDAGGDGVDRVVGAHACDLARDLQDGLVRVLLFLVVAVGLKMSKDDGEGDIPS